MLWQSEAKVTNHTLPNFIIAGINKAGTTSVYTYLNSHPQVCGSSIKEVGFFNKEYTGQRDTDLQRYGVYFDQCKSANSKIIFEATPNYLYGGEKSAKRIAELIPKVKLLFILRDPVSYLYSRYNFSVNNKQDINGNKISFEEYVRRNVDYCDRGRPPNMDGISKQWLLGCIQTGKYAGYLKEFYARFPHENIKVMFFEDLKDNALKFMYELCEFLEIDKSFYKTYEFYYVNKTYTPKHSRLHSVSIKLNKMMEPYFRRHPEQKRQLTALYKRINQRNSGYSPMPESMKTFLLDYYRDSNAELVGLLGVNRYPRWLTDDLSGEDPGGRKT
jgi:hypothetical protein